MKTKEQILELKQPLPNKPVGRGGVYFLIKDEIITYVGKSEDYINRLVTHQREWTKHFDCFTVIPEEDPNMRSVLEALYITAFDPAHNIQTPSKKDLRRALEMLAHNQIWANSQ